MGHYLEPYKAERCHHVGYKEIYVCNECAKLYTENEEAVMCCTDEKNHRDEDLKK